MDYEKEIENLNNGTNVFKPVEGEYTIVIIGEPERCEYKASDGTVTPQIKLNIQVNAESFVWYIGVGKTYASVYGQLMLIGKAKGQLNGEKISLLVEKDDDKNKYTIKEATNLIPSKEESVTETLF